MKRSSLTLIITVICILNLFAIGQTEQFIIKSKIKTEQFYRSQTSNDIYAINVTRLSSSHQTDKSKCMSKPKIIEVTEQKQLFRLGPGSKNRKEKIYQKLTSLNDQENIIEEFQTVGRYLFLISTDGSGYFVNQNNTKVVKVKTNQFQNQSESGMANVVIKDLNQRAVIITKDKISLCKIQNSICDEVQGYSPIQNFITAELYTQNSQNFLFILAKNVIHTYELTANSKLKNYKSYASDFFNVSRMSIESMYKTSDNKLIFLDKLSGLRQVSYKDQMNEFSPGNKLIYEQYGCYQMVGQNKGEQFVLACAPSSKSYFVLKLIKSNQFTQTKYQPFQTVFIHEKVYQISYVENILLSRVFSGVKMHWSSKKQANPYPFHYRNAGEIFLHNAIQSKIKIIDGVKTIYLAAEDQIRKYKLKSVQPYVFCYSTRQILQEYAIKYYFPCKTPAFSGQQNICTVQEYLTFDAWQHKQIKINTMLIPFILSFFGVCIIAFAFFKIYKSYHTDLQSARLKYQTDDNFQFYET